MHIVDDKEGLELTLLGNGHSKTSRSGSIISILSNGVGNGVLKHKTVNMSPENLKQIGDAFTTKRDEYANFDAQMDASAPTLAPKIITEDVSTEKKTTVFCPEETTESESRLCNAT